MSKELIVSICCNTYNHEKYIRDAIEGFLMQKTTFPIEIIIHDDASTDNTAEIVKSYAEKHPDLILPILQTENQYSKKQGSIMARFVFPRARGKYIALCEGDDYWIDPLKLQKQVDFLDVNPDCSWCFHPARTVYMDGKGINSVIKPRKIPRNSKFTAKDIILGGGGIYATASAMFRSYAIKDLPEWFFRAPVGDFPLALIASSKGDAGYIDDIMCLYRRNVSNSWSSLLSKKEDKWNRILNLHIETEKYFQEFNVYSDHRFDNYLNTQMIRKKCQMFMWAFSLPVEKYIWNERMQRLRALAIPNDVGYLLKFGRTFFCVVASALSRKIKRIMGAFR